MFRKMCSQKVYRQILLQWLYRILFGTTEFVIEIFSFADKIFTSDQWHKSLASLRVFKLSSTGTPGPYYIFWYSYTSLLFFNTLITSCSYGIHSSNIKLKSKITKIFQNFGIEHLLLQKLDYEWQTKFVVGKRVALLYLTIHSSMNYGLKVHLQINTG